MGEVFPSIGVFDIGAYSTRIGLAESELPSASFSSVVAEDGHVVDVFGLDQNDLSSRPSSLESFVRPITCGRITHKDKFADLLSHSFDLLTTGLGSDLFAGVFSLPIKGPPVDRELIATILFEEFGLHQLCLEANALFALLAKGSLSGLAVCSGDSVTSATVFHEGRVASSAVAQNNIAGDYLNKRLSELLQASHVSSTRLAADDLGLYKLKNALCFVSPDINNELDGNFLTNSMFKKYRLPDGTTIHVENERFLAPEALFNPRKYHVDSTLKGVAVLAWESLANSEIDVRGETYKNVVLSGGNTLLSGFHTRLYQELLVKVPVNKRSSLKVVAERRRDQFEWLGGSIFGSLPQLESFSTSRAEFLEHGSYSIFTKKHLVLNSVMSN